MPDRLQAAKYQRIAEATAQFARARFSATGQRCDLLDVGGWTGMSRRFIEIHQGAEHINYHGAGTFPKGRRAIYKNRDWTLCDCNLETGLPGLESNAYDVVICATVVSRIDQVEMALGELARVLKPGGLWVLCVPARWEQVHFLSRYVGPMVDRLRARSSRRRLDSRDVQRYSIRSLTKMIRRATDLCRIRSKRLRGVSFRCREVQITATKRVASASRRWGVSQWAPFPIVGDDRVAAIMADDAA